jgi:apolipoprotein N-acyltransferase
MSSYLMGWPPARRMFASVQGAAPNAFAQAMLVLLAGVVLGWLAWGEGRAPALAALLPVLVALSRSRIHAFLLGLGYTVALLRHTAAFIGSWFDDSLLIGAAAVLAYGLISGAVWCLGWSRSDRPWRKSLAVVVAWTVALLPPATVGLPGHPLIAWGAITPGLGWVGVALALAVPAGLVWWLAEHRLRPLQTAAVLGALLASLGAVGILQFVPGTSYGPATVAVNTAWGKLDGVDDVLRRVESMGQMSKQLAQQEKPATVIWPESILGNYDPALYPVLDIALLKAARASGQTQIIGMDLPTKEKHWENAAVAFYPDGRSARAVARQPAPLSLWRPWQETNSFVADWTASNVLTLSNTMRAAFIFCYEEYLPVLYLMNEAQGRVDMYVAVTNTWAAQSPVAAEIQTQHSLGMARLFGRPYVKAENRPLKAE